MLTSKIVLVKILVNIDDTVTLHHYQQFFIKHCNLIFANDLNSTLRDFLLQFDSILHFEYESYVKNDGVSFVFVLIDVNLLFIHVKVP